MPDSEPSVGSIDGARLRELWSAASEILRENAAAIDAINVYPVPDGDTGSNMSATLREAVEVAALIEEPVTAGRVLAALAKGALYGARGNSGVILSQALRGLVEGVGADAVVLDGVSLARGLIESSAAAYAAVSTPVEGTMLTVLRAAAGGATAAVREAGGAVACAPVLVAALQRAEEAEADTQEQLPALREAGVPDSGGEGVCIILGGLVSAALGRAPAKLPIPTRSVSSLPGHAVEAFGFCTEFVIEADVGPIDLAAVRAVASGGGNGSVVVIGNAEVARVHAHSLDPEALIANAARFGSLSRTKVEDMTAQHNRFEVTGSGAGAKTAVLALSPGPGIDAVLRGLGASVLAMGESTKAAAGEIAAAADALRIADVVVLPNHKNVIWAAEQAVSLAQCTLQVVPTKSVPEGVAALLAFQATEPARANVAAMTAALSAPTTVEVTRAAADRTADGVTVKKSDAIALVNDRLVGSAADELGALLAGLARAGAGAGAGAASLITIYLGAEVPLSREAIREAIDGAFPGGEVEMVDGGQPLYPFIASVET